MDVLTCASCDIITCALCEGTGYVTPRDYGRISFDYGLTWERGRPPMDDKRTYWYLEANAELPVPWCSICGGSGIWKKWPR